MESGPEREAFHRRSIRLKEYDYTQAGAYFVTVCTQHRECMFGEIVNGEMRLNQAGNMVESVWKEMPENYPGVDVDAFTVMPNHVHGIIVLAPIPVGAGPCTCPGDGGKPAVDGRHLPHHRQPPGVDGQPRVVAPTAWAKPPVGGHVSTRSVPVGAGPSACPNVDVPRTAGDPGSPPDGQPRGVAPTMSLSDVVHRFKSLTTTRYRHGVARSGWRPFTIRLWQRNFYEHVVRSEDDMGEIHEYIAGNPACWAEDENNPDVVARGTHLGREGVGYGG